MVEPERLSRFEWTERCRIDLETISDCVKTKQLPHKKEEHIEIWALDKSVQYADKKFAMPIKFVRPQYHKNPNLASQKGILTYWQVMKPLTEKNGEIVPDLLKKRDESTLDKQICEYLDKNNLEERAYIYRIALPRNAAVELYQYAKRNHCDASYLFPGYSGVARCMEEDSRLTKLESDGSSPM